jgi:FlaA1/EpsC-like NDP-sugar epimerase/lipopolysaccharide/colanic/teichoic acid biosynthesis glycosyltransferase
MLKRLMDIVVSGCGCIVLSPLFMIVAVAIRITSPGPVFFRQIRVGLGGRHFRIFKFRTMKVATQSKQLLTTQGDSRITKTGRILRLTKIDELPQLFNVFIGQMSLVGPRPEIPELVAVYTPEQQKLLTVKPGITSPASIYHRDEEEIVGTADEIFEYHRTVLIPQKAGFDLNYVEKVSFLYDLKLIMLTLISVFTNQSGYMHEHTLKQRRLLIFLVHVSIAVFCYYIAFVIRFDAHVPHDVMLRFMKTLPLAILFKVVFLSLFGMSQGYWRYVGFKDVISGIYVVIFSMISMAIVDLLFLDPSYPSGVIAIDGILFFILFTSFRFSTRFMREAFYPIIPKSKEKVLILGASDRGEMILNEILRNPDIAYEVVGFIDLDQLKRGIRIHGFKVLGTIDSLEGILSDSGISIIINTYPMLNRDTTSKLSRLAAVYNVKIQTLPSITEVLTHKVNVNKLRDLKYEDLLGREVVKLDKELLDTIYKDRTILITGAGGSIGSELVRQLLVFSPKKLLLLDKDETLLFEILTEIQELKLTIPVCSLIGDIRDRVILGRLLTRYQPQIILHAAAYKHVPLLEEHPHEAIKNNVFGTRNLLDLATKHHVERFVMISTDKAVRPTSVMGATKKLAERVMFEIFAPKKEMKCMAVRFGNVLGSRGSVIPIFRRQIEKGGPVLITHEDITRYFMSIPEAAQLVLQAGAMGKGGEVFILNMGDPVKIKELAHRMIEHSGLIPEIDIQIQYTGLRPGEKMKEELFTEIENSQATEHEKIFVMHNKKIEKLLDLKAVNAIETT